jgi:hypothetical protein
MYSVHVILLIHVKGWERLGWLQMTMTMFWWHIKSTIQLKEEVLTFPSMSCIYCLGITPWGSPYAMVRHGIGKVREIISYPNQDYINVQQFKLYICEMLLKLIDNDQINKRKKKWRKKYWYPLEWLWWIVYRNNWAEVSWISAQK